jgi:hypothetical protein
MVENRSSKRSQEERGRGRRPGTLAAERLEARAMLATVSAGAFTRPAGLPPATEPTAYFDVTTGELELDPVGLNLSLFNFTYNTTATNITGASPGPFRYPLGTVQQAVSTADQARTLPAGGWSLVTTFPARVAGAITLTNTATLATSGPNLPTPPHQQRADSPAPPSHQHRAEAPPHHFILCLRDCVFCC